MQSSKNGLMAREITRLQTVCTMPAKKQKNYGRRQASFGTDTERNFAENKITVSLGCDIT